MFLIGVELDKVGLLNAALKAQAWETANSIHGSQEEKTESQFSYVQSDCDQINTSDMRISTPYRFMKSRLDPNTSLLNYVLSSNLCSIRDSTDSAHFAFPTDMQKRITEVCLSSKT